MTNILESSWLYPVLSFLLALLLANPIIFWLKRIKSIQSFRDLGPKSHIETKTGTPTMGAWIFLIPIFIFSTLVLLKSFSLKILLVILAFLIGAVLGALDDVLKIMGSNYKGLNSVNKLLIQFLASSFIAFFSGRLFNTEFHGVEATLLVIFNLFWAFLVLAGTSNAINLSDGLDGLATGLSAVAFLSFVWVIPNSGDKELFFKLIFIVSASLLAFFIFNKKPAKIFMGDTGSLSLGLGLGAFAYVLGLEWYLLAFAFIPLVETLSVVLQVLSSKLSRKFLSKDLRIFKMAPLHHHLELSGFTETQVVAMLLVIQITISTCMNFF